MPNYRNIAALALDEMRQKSKRAVYKRSGGFDAWANDVLGIRFYEKMSGIMEDFFFGERKRTLVASANSTGKTGSVATAIAYVVANYDPIQAQCIVVAPSFAQVNDPIFKYLKQYYGLAESRGFGLPGHINEQAEWKIRIAAGQVNMVKGYSPAAGREVGTLQGSRSGVGMTSGGSVDAGVNYIFGDESGSFGEPIFSAIDALSTSGDSRALFTGNPDYPRGYWRRYWDDPVFRDTANVYNISAYELPTMTGEQVYVNNPKFPGDDNPAMEAAYLKGLASKAWVEDKEVIWKHSNPDRFRAKVLGEFTENDDTSYFPLPALSAAWDKDIPQDNSIRPVIGADIARYGQDETVVFTNYGGRCRVFKGKGTKENPEGVWGKADTWETAEKLHGIATRINAETVVIDASGIGGGVYDILIKNPEFSNRCYKLVAVNGSYSSPDKLRWANMRTFQHNTLRKLMIARKIDLDHDDEVLRTELNAITWKQAKNGAEQITPKDEIKKEIGGSPDRADALIYCVADLDVDFSQGQKFGASAESPLDGLDDFEWQDVLTSPGMVYAGDGLRSSGFLGVNSAV